MNTKISKKTAKKKIENFFNDIKKGKEKTPKQVKKIKRLAMAKNIKLGEKRKMFCEKCLIPYSGKEKVRIKKDLKSVACSNCGHINKWKIKAE
ncbi:hypothetical protein GF378_03450 [Candidatus Pacearchaeota archaeon]|nr:hypothetical protein [Candidatus Pacearchaeota archaeon]